MDGTRWKMSFKRLIRIIKKMKQVRDGGRKQKWDREREREKSNSNSFSNR